MRLEQVVPSREELELEGWESPAADYWKGRADMYCAERDAARAELRRVWCALKLAGLQIESFERAYFPPLRETLNPQETP